MKNILILCAVGCSLAGCGDEMTAACEGAIKSRLTAPSTYSRKSVVESSSKIEKTAYQIHILKKPLAEFNSLMDMFNRDPDNMLLHVRTITYESSNALGVMLRRSEQCEFVSPDKAPTPKESLVYFMN